MANYMCGYIGDNDLLWDESFVDRLRVYSDNSLFNQVECSHGVSVKR